ncbi:hypothetical protein GC174_14955 [bacterium]|nr:hypothetical protein [bacterium]
MSLDLPTEVETKKAARQGKPPLVISDNPEVFGGLSQGFRFVKEKTHRHYLRLAMLALGLLAMIPVAFIAFRVYLEFAGSGNGRLFLDIVKILFISAALIAIVALAALPFAYKKLKNLLIDMEEVALFGRDFALFNLPIYRQQLVQLNEKLKGEGSEEAVASGLDMVKDLLPVIKLLMAKEKNFLKWGMSGFKMLKKLKGFVEGKI